MTHFFLRLSAPVLITLGLLCGQALAQNYPTKPMRLIVPTAPGGGYDFVGRVLAEKLSAELGQAMVVENRTGSGTVVGTQAAAAAAPDGYTLLMGGLANIAFTPGLYDKLPYNPATDFVPVALAGSFSYTLIARKDLPLNTLQEVMDFARANPGKLTIATGGTGTGQHVAAALLKSLAHVNILEVPYKGAQPAYTDLFGGRVDLFFDNTATVRPFLEGDRVKAIVTSNASRDPLLPQVPFGREAGLPGLVLESWIGIFAPSQTPAPVVETLRTAMGKVMQQADLRKRLEGSGVRVFNMPAKETEQFVKAEADKWPKFLRQAGIKAE
ncbi:Bug family tripartite tricarboxylate transporter substrate binding protein [Limnohabitans sp.]|uniref:Bug family tripartite tricarboxylate transporter substrate binding protein n=1 Tax=Limnohabitans sp. TaxID=1907725 RepID=UPI0038BDA20E